MQSEATTPLTRERRGLLKLPSQGPNPDGLPASPFPRTEGLVWLSMGLALGMWR